MSNNCSICSTKCMGFPGNKGGCCTIDDRDWIIGPNFDSEEFIQRVSQKFNREVKYEEIFIEYSEGKNLFPERSVWQMPENYPAIRMDFSHSKLPCIFYNTTLGVCSIYDIRPITCQIFECEYLSQNT